MAETGLNLDLSSQSLALLPLYGIVSFTNVQDKYQHPDPNTTAKRVVSLPLNLRKARAWGKNLVSTHQSIQKATEFISQLFLITERSKC